MFKLSLPPPDDDLQLVSIDSLATALRELNVNVVVEDVIAAVREEEQAKLLAQANERRATRKPPATSEPAFLQLITYRYASHTPSLGTVFQLAVQKKLSRMRRAGPRGESTSARLAELAKQTFPEDKASDPFTLGALEIQFCAQYALSRCASRCPIRTRLGLVPLE